MLPRVAARTQSAATLGWYEGTPLGFGGLVSFDTKAQGTGGAMAESKWQMAKARGGGLFRLKTLDSGL